MMTSISPFFAFNVVRERDYLYLESPCRPLTCTTLACGNTNSTVCALQSLLLWLIDCVVPLDHYQIHA
jgi:hypothetical protein